MRAIGLLLALSIGVQAFGDIPVNTVNDGATIKAGTYFNTAGAETRFINSAKTGIHLESGQHIRGAELFNGATNGNGGNIHIDAPDQVVRLDGNIDVRGFLKGGPLPGNGGKVTVDAGYLYQNGNIYAGGTNAGQVQFNVGGFEMGSASRIDATSMPSASAGTGLGGDVAINSTGDVSIAKGAVITTNGNTTYTDNTYTTRYGNSIIISGAAVNMDGVLVAGKVQPGSGMNGYISLVSTRGDVNIGKDAILQTNPWGGLDAIEVKAAHDVNNQGRILANGQSFGYNDPENTWGGELSWPGGTIVVSADNIIRNTGRLQADAGPATGGTNGFDRDSRPYDGNHGGTITLAAQAIENNGVIRANGGNSAGLGGSGGTGGDIILTANPTGVGYIVAAGGVMTWSKLGNAFNGLHGTITAPNPAASTNTLIGDWVKAP